MIRSLILLLAVALVGAILGAAMDPNGYPVRVLCTVFLMFAIAIYLSICAVLLCFVAATLSTHPRQLAACDVLVR